MTMKITIEGMDEVIAKLSQIKHGVEEASEEAVKAGALVVEINGKLNLDKQGLRGRTGDLINSYHVHRSGIKKGKAFAEVGSEGVIYARIHEFGGVILPKRAKVLHWKTDERSSTGHFKHKEGEGEDVFAMKSVIPARPYHRPAIDEHKSEIKDAMVEVLQRYISTQSRR